MKQQYQALLDNGPCKLRKLLEKFLKVAHKVHFPKIKEDLLQEFRHTIISALSKIILYAPLKMHLGAISVTSTS